MGNENTMTSQCLTRWNKGEEEGLETLLEHHLPWILNRVRKRLGPELRNMVESSDIVQDAAIQFFRYGPRIHISDENHFCALLARIIENVLRDKHKWFTARRREVARARPLPDDTVLHLDPPRASIQTPSQSLDRHEREAWVRLGMEILGPEDQEVLVLRQWEGLSFNEIGERLGISANAARMRSERAVTRLGRKIGALRRGKISNIVH